MFFCNDSLFIKCKSFTRWLNTDVDWIFCSIFSLCNPAEMQQKKYKTKNIEIQIQRKQQISSESFITVVVSTRPLTKSWDGRYGTHETSQHIIIEQNIVFKFYFDIHLSVICVLHFIFVPFAFVGNSCEKQKNAVSVVVAISPSAISSFSYSSSLIIIILSHCIYCTLSYKTSNLGAQRRSFRPLLPQFCPLWDLPQRPQAYFVIREVGKMSTTNIDIKMSSKMNVAPWELKQDYNLG